MEWDRGDAERRERGERKCEEGGVERESAAAEEEEGGGVEEVGPAAADGGERREGRERKTREDLDEEIVRK